MMDITLFDEIAKKEGYPVVLDEYESGGAPVYELLCEVQDSIEPQDISLGGTKGTTAGTMGRPKRRKPGQAFQQDKAGEGYTWQMQYNELSQSIGIPFETVAHLDARMMGSYIQKQVATWGESFKAEEEEFVAGLFMKGTLTAGDAYYFDGSFTKNPDPNAKFIYDGQPFFDGAHPQAFGSATFSNISTSLTLSSGNLQTAYTTMTSTNAKNERNENISIRPDVLVVPPALKFTADTILNSVQVPGSDHNDVNVVNGLVRAVPWRYLTDDATQWILGQSGKGIKVHRTALEIITWDDHSRQMRYVAAKRHFGATVTNWRNWYSADKSDS